MDKYEHRRIALKRMTDQMGRGGIARVAQALGKEPNYVSRMLYEPGKPGRKRIGEDSADKLTEMFPTWLAQDSDDSQAGSSTHPTENTTNVWPTKQTSVYPLEHVVSPFTPHTDPSHSDTNVPTLVPKVVPWEQIGAVLSKQYTGGGSYQALAIPGQFSQNVQIIQYPDDSLEPEIQSGELIAVEPGIEPWPGDIVLARGKNTGQYFAGRYVSNRSGGYKIRSNKPDRYADADHNDADVVAVMVARLSGRAGTRPVQMQGF